MPLVRRGRDNIAKLIVSTGTMRPWSATGAMFAVGNSTAAHTAASSWLLGAATTMKAMNSGWPVYISGLDSAGGTIYEWQATFQTSEAAITWNEWGILNATSTGDGAMCMLNRKQEDPALGTKSTAAIWQVSAQITFTT